ncbi:vesicular glutamate transporter 3-like isoform X2 [Sipha flava]|uniref:Vesicular glutamate transporter 3-like isoform X2 n=1 Tax=Sipha flava TaxID=143950 RepID=A0A8B8GQS5_9HEMI|nr:vesicular glutamate transporter 3-like isoform X2 [Sipha flava]
MSTRHDDGSPASGRSPTSDKIWCSSSETSFLSGVRDGCIRFKLTYWNGSYAVAFISFVGLVVCMEQYRFWTLWTDRAEINNHWVILFMIGFASTVASMTSGILACIYPAHNMFAVSVALSSVTHLLGLTIADTSHIVFDSFSVIILCQFMTIAMALPAFHGIWTTWPLPLGRRSIRHVPIVLYYALYQNSYSYFFDLETVNDLKYLSYAIGAIGLLWSGILWVYVVRKTNTRAHHLSATQKLLNIPWKSICSSKPVHAIVVANICEALGYSFDYMFLISTQIKGRSVNVLISVSILFVVFLVELFPEINCFSTACVRKFWSCLFFSSRAAFHLLYLSFPYDVEKHFNWFVDVYNAIGVLYCFGFVVNHLDISPRYASLLIGFMETVKHICHLFFATFFHVNLYEQILHAYEISALVSIAYIAAAIFYAVYASGVSQSWATTNNGMSSSRHRWNNLFV